MIYVAILAYEDRSEVTLLYVGSIKVQAFEACFATNTPNDTVIQQWESGVYVGSVGRADFDWLHVNAGCGYDPMSTE